MSKSLAILIALLAGILTPAIALAQSDGAPACLVTVAGDDAGPITTETLGDADGDGGESTAVLTTLPVEAATNGRTIVPDAVRYRNRCDHAVEVAMQAVSVSGDWDQTSAEIWLSAVAEPNAVVPVAGSSEWASNPIEIAAGRVPGPADAATGAVLVPAGSEVRTAFVVVSGIGHDGTAQVRWTVEARPAATTSR